MILLSAAFAPILQHSWEQNQHVHHGMPSSIGISCLLRGTGNHARLLCPLRGHLLVVSCLLCLLLGLAVNMGRLLVSGIPCLLLCSDAFGL